MTTERYIEICDELRKLEDRVPEAALDELMMEADELFKHFSINQRLTVTLLTNEYLFRRHENLLPKRLGPHYSAKKPSLALVASAGGDDGCVIYTVGPAVKLLIDDVGSELGDLGLDEAPVGLSVWEGRARYHKSYNNVESDDLQLDGLFRDLTDDEWTAVRARRCPWNDKDWRISPHIVDVRVRNTRTPQAITIQKLSEAWPEELPEWITWEARNTWLARYGDTPTGWLVYDDDPRIIFYTNAEFEQRYVIP